MDTIAVLKFGGSSVKNIGRIKHVADIVATYPARKKIVVVSAMGDTTDYLYGLAKHCSTQPDRRELDLLLATGEQVSITLLALALKALGISAKSCTGPQLGIHTDNCHGSARIVNIEQLSITQALAENDVVVVAGFQGLSKDGEVTTLGRGGSDTTAVAVAAACNAVTCDIFTDVDGVFTSDPNQITDAALLPDATYEEILELARAGAQVVHPRAVELAQDYKLPLRIRNTFKPAHQGTIISGETKMEKLRTACGVAVDGNLACIKLSKLNQTTFAVTELLDLFAEKNIVIESINRHANENNSETDILLTLKYQDSDHVATVLPAIAGCTGAAAAEPDFDSCKISLIGHGIGGRPELTLRFLGTLEKAKIVIKQVTSGENRISAIVAKSDAHKAAQLIHAEFGLAELSDDTALDCG